MDKNDRALLANLNERVAKGEMLNEQQAKLHERLGEKELILLRAGLATSKGSHSENHRLAYFWDYVARDKVKACPDVSTALPADVASITASESEVPINGGGVKSLIFDQSDEEDPKGVTWGPSFTFAVLVERAEYLRCWNLIRTEPRSFILLRGTKGIGKSVFIYWLIYKITKEAIMNNESLPTFLLISSGGKGRAVYELLCVDVNGLPAVQLVGPGVGADYVLSDVEFDPSVPTKHWNLNVVSYGAREEPKVFIGRVEDAREAGLKLLMAPVPLEELQAMQGNLNAHLVNFSYTVFGGSARMLQALHVYREIGDIALLKVVKEELLAFFEDTEYFSETMLIDKAALLITEQIAGAAGRHGPDDAAQASAVEHSLFTHTYPAIEGESRGTVRCFASTFMKILAGVLVENEEVSVLHHLRNILGGSGFGVVFEAQVHKTLMAKFKLGGELRLTRIYPGRQIKAAPKDIELVNVQVARKVFIRTLEDIALLKQNEYGVPIIPNFALVDAVIKVHNPPQEPYGLELQVTVADQHKGAVAKHPIIEEGMGTPSSNNIMVFCCNSDNFDGFRYVEGFVPEVKQYKMLCDWEANPAKKRKSK